MINTIEELKAHDCPDVSDLGDDLLMQFDRWAREDRMAMGKDQWLECFPGWVEEVTKEEGRL